MYAMGFANMQFVDGLICHVRVWKCPRLKPEIIKSDFGSNNSSQASKLI